MKYVKKVHCGFTLLELVVVIAVVGVLLVVAMPKLLGTSNDARVAALGGVAGALSSASAFNYGKRSAAVLNTNNLERLRGCGSIDASGCSVWLHHYYSVNRRRRDGNLHVEHRDDASANDHFRGVWYRLIRKLCAVKRFIEAVVFLSSQILFKRIGLWWSGFLILFLQGGRYEKLL